MWTDCGYSAGPKWTRIAISVFGQGLSKMHASLMSPQGLGERRSAWHEDCSDQDIHAEKKLNQR